MPAIPLIPAVEAHERMLKRRQELFAEFPTRIPFVLETLNTRMDEAIEKGVSFITVSHSEVDEVPDTDPGLFMAYLQHEGFTITRGNPDEYLIHFFNVLKENV